MAVRSGWTHLVRLSGLWLGWHARRRDLTGLHGSLLTLLVLLLLLLLSHQRLMLSSHLRASLLHLLQPSLSFALISQIPLVFGFDKLIRGLDRYAHVLQMRLVHVNYTLCLLS